MSGLGLEKTGTDSYVGVSDTGYSFILSVDSDMVVSKMTLMYQEVQAAGQVEQVDGMNFNLFRFLLNFIYSFYIFCTWFNRSYYFLLYLFVRFGIFDWFKLPEDEKNRFVNVRKIADKDWKAAQRLGKSYAEVKEDNKHVSQFKMPGTDLAQNKKAIQEYNRH